MRAITRSKKYFFLMRIIIIHLIYGKAHDGDAAQALLVFTCCSANYVNDKELDC